MEIEYNSSPFGMVIVYTLFELECFSQVGTQSSMASTRISSFISEYYVL